MTRDNDLVSTSKYWIDKEFLVFTHDKRGRCFCVEKEFIYLRYILRFDLGPATQRCKDRRRGQQLECKPALEVVSLITSKNLTP